MQQYNVIFERISLHIGGPFQKTDKYILVAMDYFFYCVAVYTLPNQEAVTITLEIDSDQYRNFNHQSDYRTTPRKVFFGR